MALSSVTLRPVKWSIDIPEVHMVSLSRYCMAARTRAFLFVKYRSRPECEIPDLAAMERRETAFEPDWAKRASSVSRMRSRVRSPLVPCFGVTTERLARCSSSETGTLRFQWRFSRHLRHADQSGTD